MTNNEPKVEEEDDVLRPEKSPSPPPLIFPPPPIIPDYQTRLAYSPTTDSKHLFTLDNAPPSRWHDERTSQILPHCIFIHYSTSTLRQALKKCIMVYKTKNFKNTNENTKNVQICSAKYAKK